MNRDELERAIWDGLRYLGLDRDTLAPHVIDRILAAADAYAAYTGGITAERRAVLASEVKKAS